MPNAKRTLPKQRTFSTAQMGLSGKPGPYKQTRDSGGDPGPTANISPMSERTRNISVVQDRITKRAVIDEIQSNTPGVRTMDEHVEDKKAPPTALVAGIRNEPYNLSKAETGTA